MIEIDIKIGTEFDNIVRIHFVLSEVGW